MTNKYKLLYLLSFTVLIATGCSKKFLEDMKSFDKYDETLFTNETQTGWYIDKMYNDYYAAFNSPLKSIVGLYSDNRSRMTEELGGTIDDRTNPQKTLINATDADNYYGTGITTGVVNNPYTRIRNCNFLLGKIEEVGTALSQQFRDRARGQSYFLRALQYYDLVRIYGGVPIITTVQSAVANDPTTQVPRATTTECIAQIVKDLDSAAKLLPLNWENAGTSYGRLTGAAALATKSRVLLTFASPLFNTDWDNTGNARWEAALQAGLAAESALSGAGYGLYGTSGKDWGEMWYKNDNAFNKEAIMVQLFSNSNAASGIISNGWEKSIRVANQTGGGGVSVPKGMIDLFPMKDGSRPKIGTNYNDTLFFIDRDPRFYRTFAFSGCKWGTKEAPNDVVWDYNWMYKGGTGFSDNNNLNSPVLVRKMSNPAGASTVNGLQFSGTDIFEYRYAELLLNIAECYAAKGDVANCLVYLGKIRNRVGIPSANNYGIGTLSGKYAAIEAVLYERRVELAYEGKRFWDVQRWKLYADDATAGNTVSKLGLTPINGTARTGYYWQYKDTLASKSTPDPVLGTRTAISIDPDAADFNTQLNNLVTFFHTNFKAVPLPAGQEMDKIGTTPVTINFRPNYYISGLHQTTLSTNPWLKQTIGWNDQNGAAGTFDYKQ